MSARTAREADFITHDGTALFYCHWPATAPRCRGAIVLLHRGHEHSARVAHLVDELDLPDFAFFAWDARGHGRSPGARGYSPGAAASVRDLQSFVEHIRDTHGVAIEDIAVVGQSVGAALAAAWAHDYAPPVRCLVLASPAFHIKLYVPFARPGLRLMHKLRGLFYVNSYVKPRFLTHDPQRIASYAADRGQHAARSARHRAADRRRCDRDHGADPAADLGRRLGRASRSAGSLLRAARRRAQGAHRAAGLLSRHARRARPRAGARAAARVRAARIRHAEPARVARRRRPARRIP